MKKSWFIISLVLPAVSCGQNGSKELSELDKYDDMLARVQTLERGDVLYYNIGLQYPGTVKLYNADARQNLKTYPQKTKVADSLVVANKGISVSPHS